LTDVEAGNEREVRPLRAKVKNEENWMRANLWGNSAVLHWNCYIALLKSEGAPGAEAATRKGDGPEHATK